MTTINSEFADLLLPLRRQLIVSCQARPGEALDDPAILAAIARAVVAGGAAAIRANYPRNIRAIRECVEVPIFGIFKQTYPDSPVYITPTLKEAEAIVEAGCDILTIEATNQPRPNGETLESYMKALKRNFQMPIMADISTLEEGMRAAELGADIVATTLAGYTPYSRQLQEADFQLVEELAAAVEIPVIAEGRIQTPADARRMLESGAFAVVVGSMITRPGHITAYFIQEMIQP
jgi:N-acylglucosamine-6-phosphate 2-epimerase